MTNVITIRRSPENEVLELLVLICMYVCPKFDCSQLLV